MENFTTQKTTCDDNGDNQDDEEDDQGNMDDKMTRKTIGETRR